MGLIDCGICGSDNYSAVRTIRGYEIVKCNQCNTLFTNLPTTMDYTTTVSFENAITGYKTVYWPKRYQSALKYFDVFEKFRETSFILDIGSGYGYFLNECQKRGWTSQGVEIAVDQAEWSSRTFGITVYTDISAPKLKKDKFDVITLWDVIEHVPDPNDLISKCWSLLRPGGLILVKTPNARVLESDFAARSNPILSLYRNMGYPANPQEHLYHFTQETMSPILETCGFSISAIETKQNWNEWIVTGKTRWIKQARWAILKIAYYLNLPYQLVFLAEKTE